MGGCPSLFRHECAGCPDNAKKNRPVGSGHLPKVVASSFLHALQGPSNEAPLLGKKDDIMGPSNRSYMVSMFLGLTNNLDRSSYGGCMGSSLKSY